jgi:hypothetical protein
MPSNRRTKTGHNVAMHLVSCARPMEPLEVAPRTALLADSADDDRWDCFWSGQCDDYFVRCIKPDGATEWFRMEDEVAAHRTPETRVIELRPRSAGRVSLILAQSPDGRRMLVGSARRTSR